MYQILAEDLWLPNDATEVSQAVALGSNNLANLQIELINDDGAGAFTNPLEVKLEGSNDLETGRQPRPRSSTRRASGAARR